MSRRVAVRLRYLQALFDLADGGHYEAEKIVNELIAYTDTLAVFSEVSCSSPTIAVFSETVGVLRRCIIAMSWQSRCELGLDAVNVPVMSLAEQPFLDVSLSVVKVGV